MLLIDNYDSFTFNLAHYFQELGEDVTVVRNDALTVEQAIELNPPRVCISPGPGRPADAGNMPALLKHFAGRVPVLGVCLGMQAMAELAGATILHAPAIVHGKTTAVEHTGEGVFKGIPSPFQATRYHSLCVDESTLPPEYTITARTADGVVMAIRHTSLPLEGVQFHPEAILTEHGHKLLQNWLGA
jgi:anthranilate synthase component II